MRVFEIFHSLQGEGPTQGLPTVFVRFSGCDLRCHWCDTDYAWSGGKDLSTTDILKTVQSYNCRRVCLTGGEPLLQKELPALSRDLLAMGCAVSVETGGHLDLASLPPEVQLVIDVKMQGSGEGGSFHLQNLNSLKPTDELKFVCASIADVEEALSFCARMEAAKKLPRGLRLCISPVHGSLNLEEAASRILSSGQDVRLCLQLHKYVWSPDQRGV
jgi:7-carboxy-7-deazaguanine synthase